MNNLDSDVIFDDNIDYMNHIMFKTLLVSIPITVIISVLDLLKIFNIDHKTLNMLIGYSLSICAVDFLLLKFLKNKFKLVTGFFSLIFLEGYVAFAGSNHNIGIYMTFSIIPFITSLYYNFNLTCSINIISYLLMLTSLYFKWLTGASIFINGEGFTGFWKEYFPVAVGFTIEYIVIFIISISLTRRNKRLLTQMSTTLENLRISHKHVEEKNEELEDTQVKIIRFVAECLGSHDLFTGKHVLHTQEYVRVICNKMVELNLYKAQLTEENITLFSNAAFLHDIGKIHIPEGILNKTGKFTDEEFERMKSHPAEGKKLLEFLPKIGDGKFNIIAVQMAYCHHEKWDGTGYPNKISGEDIPLCARIMAAADVLDALISQRLYKKPMSIDEAMKVFEESKGKHFEACIADAVIASRDTIQKIDEKFKAEETDIYNQELEWWNSYHSNK